MHPLIPSCERPDLPLTIAASRDLSKLPVGPMNTGWIDFCKRRVQQEDFNPFAPGGPLHDAGAVGDGADPAFRRGEGSRGRPAAAEALAEAYCEADFSRLQRAAAEAAPLLLVMSARARARAERDAARTEREAEEEDC